MVLQPRLIALQTQAQNQPSIRQIDTMLLELSYMQRNPDTVELVDQLLDRRNYLSRLRAMAVA